jgi:hypothetical protein
VIESGRIADMADHPHTIDRWDDATGENLIEQIAAVGDFAGACAEASPGRLNLSRPRRD